MQFDTFLSHNSKDRDSVQLLAQRLKQVALSPFLDVWHMGPGEQAVPVLARAIEESRTTAVFIGPNGLGPWQDEEVQAAIAKAIRSRGDHRVIPVLLPGASPNTIPGFLAQRIWVDFRSGIEGDAPFQRLVAAIRGIAPATPDFHLPDEPAPYRGLQKFESRHAGIFFGRARETGWVLEKLRVEPFVGIIGASGAGKSSLALAGVVPRLTLGCAQTARTLVVTPGPGLLQSVAHALASLAPAGDRLLIADELSRRLAAQPGALRAALQLYTPPGEEVTLVLDQLEETFTHLEPGRAREEARMLAANLLEVVAYPLSGFRVIATIRADLVEKFIETSGWPELLHERAVLLGPMSADCIREAIIEPAKAVGALFEEGLVPMVMEQVRHHPKALPLLQDVLEELWRQRKGVWLTRSTYEEIGGVVGALRRRADEALKRLSADHQQVARSLFVRLVSIREGLPDTRQRLPRRALDLVGIEPPVIDRVLQHFAGPSARLLVLDQDAIEVSHEILIEEWSTLKAWVSDRREALKLRQRLSEAARDWNDNNRHPDFLFLGARLTQAEEGVARDLELTVLEQEFLQAGVELRERIRREEQERLIQQRLAEERLTQEADQRRLAMSAMDAMSETKEKQASRNAWFVGIALLLSCCVCGRCSQPSPSEERRLKEQEQREKQDYIERLKRNTGRY